MDKRKFLKIAGFTLFNLFLFPRLSLPSQQTSGKKVSKLSTSNSSSKNQIITKVIPSTGETIPTIGMGTWQTFNVGDDTNLRNLRTEVLMEFFLAGGGMIDSSPMYGSSEEVIGYGLNRLKTNEKYKKNKALQKNLNNLFSAAKIWTPLTLTEAGSKSKGLEQYNQFFKLWGIETFDLIQVHNLVDLETHLEFLFDKKKNTKKVRYVGVTTSHGRRHSEIKTILKNKKKYPIDYVQLSYSMGNRSAEELLRLAKHNGIAVIANRPYQRGSLIKDLKSDPSKKLPKIGYEVDCKNWAEYLLKYIISHPAITCTIPATTNPQHMKENMGAMRGYLPNEKERQKMLKEFQNL